MQMLTASNIVLTWSATSNVTYRLEFITEVAASNWSAVSGDVTTTTDTATKLEPLTTTNRFYRIRVLP